jgi:hypothetical protein
MSGAVHQREDRAPNASDNGEQNRQRRPDGARQSTGRPSRATTVVVNGPDAPMIILSRWLSHLSALIGMRGTKRSQGKQLSLSSCFSLRQLAIMSWTTLNLRAIKANETTLRDVREGARVIGR